MEVTSLRYLLPTNTNIIFALNNNDLKTSMKLDEDFALDFLQKIGRLIDIWI